MKFTHLKSCPVNHGVYIWLRTNGPCSNNQQCKHVTSLGSRPRQRPHTQWLLIDNASHVMRSNRVDTMIKVLLEFNSLCMEWVWLGIKGPLMLDQYSFQSTNMWVLMHWSGLIVDCTRSNVRASLMYSNIACLGKCLLISFLVLVNSIASVHSDPTVC